MTEERISEIRAYLDDVNASDDERNKKSFNFLSDKLMGSNCKSQKGWEPQQGELVAVKNDIDSDWRAMVFIEKYGEMYRCEICDNSEEEDTYWDQCEPLHKHFMFRSKEKCEVQDDFR